mmetsp:Transcript_316/g.519  ORF Transcript_316/g.519 Transcript_316/m.519 type:complete len:457 (-) Transcript_316:215-1585(-)
MMRNFNSRTLRTSGGHYGGGMANGMSSSSYSSSQQQPTVSQLLNTLGGVYRDPSRVDRDASALLRSSVGNHLKPNIGDLVVNQNGDKTTVLLLAGTIAMNYRGNTYQILVHIYLPPAYPLRPPIAFVRLGAPNMYLKENHAHVGQDGQVYLHYLHEWRAPTHNLIELVVAMSSVFSNDPPVFTKKGTSSSSSSTAAATTTRSSMSSSTSASLPPSYEDSSIQDAIKESMKQAEIDQQRRLELQREEEQQAQLARERAQAEEAARLQAQEEQARIAQETYDAQALADTREKVRLKMIRHLEQCARDTKTSIQHDMMDQRRLNAGTDQLNSQLAQLESLQESIQSQIETVDVATTNIEEWLQEATSSENDSSSDGRTKEIHIDDLCKPTTPVYNQMLELSAENASLTDALYFLDKALARGSVDLTTHLKYVRKLSKKQFMIRAHLVKIGQILKERRYH